MSGNWKAVKEDLDWSINKGDPVNGRSELKSVIEKGDHTSVHAIGEAFKMGQRDGHKVANYLRCAHEDAKRLYSICRRLIGVEPQVVSLSPSSKPPLPETSTPAN